MPLRVVHGSSQDVSARHRSFGADALDRPDQTTGKGDTGADLPPVADSPSAWSAQNEERIEAHNFVNFIGYCLHVTLKNLARPRAPGLTPEQLRAALGKVGAPARAGTDTPRRVGEVRHDADGGCPFADHRRAASRAAPAHRPDARPATAASSTRPETAGAAPAPNIDLARLARFIPVGTL